MRLNGALSIAQEEGRWRELKRQATTAQLYNFDIQILNKDQVKEKVPLVKNDDLLGGIFMPGDGSGDPSGINDLLAKAARAEGVKIYEDSPVNNILVKNKKVCNNASKPKIATITSPSTPILLCLNKLKFRFSDSYFKLLFSELPDLN